MPLCLSLVPPSAQTSSGVQSRPAIAEAAIARHAALGIRAHSGWSAVVAVAGDLDSPQIIARERVSVIDPESRGAKQPYHFAKTLSLTEAETHLAGCAATARRLAAGGLQAICAQASASGWKITACAILTASGRPVPALPEILASHPMIHTAEGEFFRNAFADACAQLAIRVAKFRERDLLATASAELRLAPAKIKTRLAAAGRAVGPPWSQDQKNASLAAFLLLAGRANSRC